MKSSLPMIATMILIGIAPAEAREGLSLGISASYSNLSGRSQDALDDAYFESLEPGPGVSLTLGWGFNDYFAAEIGASRSYHETTFMGLSNLQSHELNGLSAILKFSLPTTRMADTPRISDRFRRLINFVKPFEPYLFLGAGHYGIGDSSNTYYRGIALEGGIGVDLYLTSVVSVNAGFSGKNIWFTTGKFSSGEDTSVGVVSGFIGIAFHLF